MTGENIEEIFNKLTQTLIYKIDIGEIPEDLVVINKQITQLSSSPLGNEDIDKKNGFGHSC